MDLDEWPEQAGRAAYEKVFLKHAPADTPRWDDIDEAARESWRDIARAVLGEGKIEFRPSAELAEIQTREENERLRKIAREASENVANFRRALNAAVQAGVQMEGDARDAERERDQLKEINDRMGTDRERLIAERNEVRAQLQQQESVNAGLRRAYEHACERGDKYKRRTAEWREKYINAGVEAELKLQRGWPDFRDTVAELDEMRAALEAGEASDGHHTHNELYEYRLLYNAHAARGWLAAGLPVSRSTRHHDGEACFGGGWFVVVATLPSGQVSNHYKLADWDLFDGIPVLSTAPMWDGHTPAEAAERLRSALDGVRACTGCGKCSVCRSLPQGLCGDRADHAAHLHDSESLGRFWCHADQTQRVPYALERRKGNDDADDE